MIRCIYKEEPKFPVREQQPDAQRLFIGDWWVDFTGDPPTLAEVLKQATPTEADLSKVRKDSLLATGDVYLDYLDSLVQVFCEANKLDTDKIKLAIRDNFLGKE